MDANSDTRDTAGSSNATTKLYLVGAGSQAAYATTYSNSNVYTQSGNLYAANIYATTAVYANNKILATQQ